MARALEEAKQFKEALAAWYEYRKVTTDPKEQTQVDGRISALTKLLEQVERLEQERREKVSVEEVKGTPPPAATERPVRHTSPIAWTLTGVGLAGVISGVVLGLVANGDHANAVVEPAVDRARTLQNRAGALALAANLSYAIGGAIAGGGLIWLSIDWMRAPGASRSSSGWVTSVGFRF